MKKRQMVTSSILVIVIAILGYVAFASEDEVVSSVALENPVGVFEGLTAIVYKNPTCGCCVGYAHEMEKQGFEVEVVEMDDLTALKKEYGIGSEMESCHTVSIGNYFIEGHVPFDAVEKLLIEQPAIDGIALPRMPSGTPGMPGPKRAPYEIYQISGGETSPYMTI